MDRVRNLSHINNGVNQTADALIAGAVNGTDEQKILLLRLFSAVKNRREFLTDIDEPLINTVRTYLVRMVGDEQLDVGSLCGIAFNKLRATLPVYLSKNIPSDAFYNSGKVTDRKLSEFACEIKNARDDGARAAGLFFDRAYDVRLRLLGFALCAEYILIPTTPVEEFEKNKFRAAKLRGDKNMYAKGSPLGIQYKEGFIQQLLKSFPRENRVQFFDIFMNLDFNYKTKKEKTLHLIKELLSRPEIGAPGNNSAERMDNGTAAASTTSITTTTTNTTATTTTTTTASLPTITTTTTTASLPIVTTTTKAVVDDNYAIPLNALIAAAPAYLKGGKDQNSYIFTLSPEATSSEEILDKMALYIRNFKKNRGPVQTTLYDEFKENTGGFVKDVKILSASSLENSERVAFNRELSTKDGRSEFTNNANYSMLGNDMAEIRTSEEARKPGNQLAFLMRVPMWNGTGNQEAPSREQAVWPLILSVCAPALDFQTQPEWKQYVEENGDLKEDAFGVALSTISKQVIASAKANPGHRVVLSAFGMSNFIKGLNHNSHPRALAIGVANMQQLITELRQENIEVGYTDGEKGGSFWQEVRNRISEEIEYMGRVPGQWISNEVIIVNAWDPCSVIGNGCKNDDSIDGFIGRNSLVHEAHVMLIRAFRENLLTTEKVAARV